MTQSAGSLSFQVAISNTDLARKNAYNKNSSEREILLQSVLALQQAIAGIRDAFQQNHERIERLHQKVDRIERKIGSV
jgi:predicted  nucleic acid-binding Zn-ribbon protein